MTEEASDIPPALSGASAMSGVASPVSGEPNTETITDRQEASEPGLPEPLAAQAPAPAGDPSASPPPETEPSEKTDLSANKDGALLSSGSTGSVSGGRGALASPAGVGACAAKGSGRPGSEAS